MDKVLTMPSLLDLLRATATSMTCATYRTELAAREVLSRRRKAGVPSSLHRSGRDCIGRVHSLPTMHWFRCLASEPPPFS